jgi:putative NIF3 family GTP cyclohydrolase 1 type 2
VRAGWATTGTFRPLPGSDPYEGKVGHMEEVDEWRVEVIVPATQRDQVIRAMIDAHPYEEVAYDAYPLHNMAEPYGSARVGQLKHSSSLNDWAQRVQVLLNAPNVRIVRAKDSITRVACVPGSGASFLDACARAGVDCLVTGDIKHHDALKAKAVGVSIIDASHTATERAAVPMIAHVLQSTLKGVEVLSCDIDTNPFESS